jgi:assimilatory nitrate reductase catalytic subunit
MPDNVLCNIEHRRSSVFTDGAFFLPGILVGLAMNRTEESTLTTCPYCGVGCGVKVTQQADAVLPVAGDLQHPANFGKLCVKGSALHETLDKTDRQLYPEYLGERVSWDAALDTVAAKLKKVIEEDGPQAVAIYAAGQILTEDYYVANKLMKGFIGSGNLDTNSRLCMASAVASYKRAFGSDTVPGCYEDLEQAELLVLVGSNAAWAHPILYQRMAAAKKANPALKVVVIDPRRTASCDLADLHLAIRPGSDAYLYSALLGYLAQIDALDHTFIGNHTQGFEGALENAKASFSDIDATAELLKVTAEDLKTFFDWFASIDKAVTFYSQGINQSSSGTDKGNSIINVHLATGKIGKPGAAPFSITGQPNAMGGREVGGLANQLAAHMDFSDQHRDIVQRFWQAPNPISGPGLKAVDLFDAVKKGEIKFVWVMSTNPLVSMPDAADVRAALASCELVVVSDCMANTDTMDVAHLKLPAASWGEKNGIVTNSERRISRQRGFLTPAGESKPDWWALTQVARRLGYEEAFPFEHPSEVFDEYTRLTAFENQGSRDLDLSGLSGMTLEQYDAMAPVQWPVNKQFPQGRKRFFEDGRFYTPSGRANFVAIEPSLPLPRSGTLVMNTGRVRDHWHTMTRTAKSARLAQHIREPYADIHPADAKRYQVEKGKLVRVHNAQGDILVRAKISDSQREGEIFVPMHWTNRYASQALMGTLIDKSRDPISGQPECKYTGVSIAPFETNWQGLLLSRKDLGPIPCEYWAYGPTDSCHGYEIAGNRELDELTAWARSCFPHADWITLSDQFNHHERLVGLINNRVEIVLFVHKDYEFDTRQWLIECFEKEQLNLSERMNLIAGSPREGAESQGATICSCFSVGEKTISDAIQQGCDTVEALGKQLKCGTNCGSCIPELKELIATQASVEEV